MKKNSKLYQKLKEAAKTDKRLRDKAQRNYLESCKENAINPTHYLPIKEGFEWLEAIRLLNKHCYNKGRKVPK